MPCFSELMRGCLDQKLSLGSLCRHRKVASDDAISDRGDVRGDIAPVGRGAAPADAMRYSDPRIVGPAVLRDASMTLSDATMEARTAPDGDWWPDRMQMRLRAQFLARQSELAGRVHPLIRARLDGDSKLSASVSRRRYSLSFDGPVFDTPYERGRLDLLNRLFLIREEAGARPALSDRRANVILLNVNHVMLELVLVNDVEIRGGHNSYPLERSPANAVRTLAILKAGGGGQWYRSWRDAKGRKLE